MKAFLCALVLASLQTLRPAQSFEADIHYSTTYVLARAAGWTEADAMIIASANQGVDENEDTVAAIEIDATPNPLLARYFASSPRQAEKNLRFHCFSSTDDHAGRIAADVREVMSGHFASVVDRDGSARAKTRRLIALGVALHCQQDAHAHVDFGGSCGAYAGSCYGHTHETFFDQVIFRLVGKHYFNPDHPGVSGARLLATLQGTASALARHRTGGSAAPISTRELAALASALRQSGLELPDEVRRDCNRHIAGKWLHEFWSARGDSRRGKVAVQSLTPRIAVACGNASLASASAVRIPEPRFPRLAADGSAHLVNPDGSYAAIPGGSLEAAPPGVRAEHHAGLGPNYSRTIKVQLSHWSQILALPPVGQAHAAAVRDPRRRGTRDSSVF